MRPLALAPNAALLALALGAGAPAAAQRILWSSSPATASLPETPVAAAFSEEFADDFDAWGEVAGISIAGADCAGCAPAAVAAVELRFWSPRAGGGPGALEAEYRLEVGDDHLKVDPLRPAQVEIRLATPFAARGRHFVSVRLEFAAAGVWAWHTSRDAQRFDSAWQRGAGGLWAPAGPPAGGAGDLAFALASSAWDDVDRARGCGRFELEAPAPPAGVEAWRLIDVAALDAEGAIAVGVGKAAEGDRALAFERRLGVWRELAPPLPPASRLEAVETMPSGEVWLAGSYLRSAGPALGTRQPLVLVYHPERELWERLDPPILARGEGELFDLATHGEREIWLVGTALETVEGATRSTALLLRWNGVDFERHELPTLAAGGAEGLAAVASDGAAVWAVGGGGQSVRAPLVARWDGRAWQRVAAGGLDRAGALDSVAARPGELWIGGVTLAQDPLLVSFDGSRWLSHDSPAGGRALAAPEKGDVLTAGDGLASFHAALWQAEPGARGLALVGLSRPADCAVFAAGYQIAQGTERGLLLRLVRGGFADGFESGGFEAWSTLVAPAE